jgi:hypothetical protein
MPQDQFAGAGAGPYRAPLVLGPFALADIIANLASPTVTATVNMVVSEAVLARVPSDMLVEVVGKINRTDSAVASTVKAEVTQWGAGAVSELLSPLANLQSRWFRVMFRPTQYLTFTTATGTSPQVKFTVTGGTSTNTVTVSLIQARLVIVPIDLVPLSPYTANSQPWF